MLDFLQLANVHVLVVHVEMCHDMASLVQKYISTKSEYFIHFARILSIDYPL
jgi:hypothetical protein